MEDETVEQVFDKGPNGEAHKDSHDRGHPAAEIKKKGKRDEGGSGYRIDKKIGKECRMAQSRRRCGHLSAL
jgi:hypothetical protein